MNVYQAASTWLTASSWQRADGKEGGYVHIMHRERQGGGARRERDREQRICSGKIDQTARE